MGQITNVVLVYLLSLLSAFGSGGGAKIPHPGTPIILLSTRNATYIIPVRSNGQFKPPLASLNIIRNNGARLRTEVRERPHAYAARKAPRQAILFPMPTNTRILQAMPAGSPGSGSLLNRRPPGVQDFVFCFEAGGTEMCVRTDMTAGRVTAVARSLQEVRKRRRKALPKKKVHRRRRALRSWKDTVRDTFWPKKRESGKFGGNDEPPFMEETMDVFTFKNLTVWRRTRWEQVMNTTDLGKHANASAKLNATLREPAEKDVNVQAVKDILLLHEMLELTEWPSAKKWAEFEKGSRLLVTTQTGTNKPGRKENGWGPDLDPPYRALRVQTGIRPLARERHILEEGWGTDLDPPYGLLRVQTGMKPLARDRHVLQEGWGTDLDPPYELSRAKHEHTHPSEVESKPIPFGGRLIPPEWYEDPQPQFVIRENNGYGTKSKSKESNKLSGTMAWSNREPAEDEYVSAIPQSGSDIYTPAQQSNREAGSSVRVGHQNSAGASSSRYDHRRRKYGFGGTEQHGEWNEMSGDYAHSGKNMDDVAYRRRRYQGASSWKSFPNRRKWHRPYRGGGMAAKQPNMTHKTRPTRSMTPTMEQSEMEQAEMNELIANRKAFGNYSNRLVLFAETVRLGTTQSEFGWKLLTIGFKLFSNSSHITEEEMKDFVRKLPEPMPGSTFQDTMNSMIIYDLIAFNGSGDYNKWNEIERRRLPIGAARNMSRVVQSRLASARSLKAMVDLYVMQLGELIIMKLSILSLNTSYDKDVEGLLSKKLNVDVTPESLAMQKDFLSKNHVSAKVLGDVYSKELWDAMLLNLISLNDAKGTSSECTKDLPLLSSKNANNTEAMAKEVDAIINKLKDTNNTIKKEKCVKEVFFLKLLTLAKNTEHEIVWRDVIVMKWANLSGTEAAEGATFSPQTISVLRGFVHASDLSIFNSLVQQIRIPIHKPDMDKSSDSAVRSKLLKAVRNASSPLRQDQSSETFMHRSVTEDTEKNGSVKEQPSVPGAQPELITHDGSSDVPSQGKDAAVPAVQQEETTRSDFRNNDA